MLVTTMHQTDMRKYKEMNLQTNAVIANQTDSYSYQEKQIEHSIVRMISTHTRGLSRNRNIALALSSSEFILFADDDLRFIDGYADIIEKEFLEHPEAEAIKFNLYDISEKRKISMKPIQKFEKGTVLNMGSSGVWGIVIKKDILIRSNLKFNEEFGTGTELYCGEDTIFIVEMLRKKVKLYRSPKVIAGIDQSDSSWFEGHNDRYFEVSGRFFSVLYPKIASLLAVRSAFRFSRRSDCDMSFLKILKCYLRGIHSNK